MDDQQQQQLREQRQHRFAVAVCCAVGALLFWTVGWLVVRPVDPLGPLSLLQRVAGGESLAALTFKIAAVAALTSVAAASLVGRRLPEAGAFAVAFGLLNLTLASSGMRALLTGFHSPDATVEMQIIAFHKLIRESFCWFAVILVSLIVTRLVEQWLAARPAGNEQPGGSATPAVLPNTNASASLLKDDDMFLGMLASGVGAAGAAVVMAIACQSDDKGQVCFSLFAAFFLGTVLAHRICRTQLGVWYCLSVLVVAVAGYWWASRPALARPFDLLTLAPIALARPLPAEYMSWGTAGAIAGFWFATRSSAARKAKGV